MKSPPVIETQTMCFPLDQDRLAYITCEAFLQDGFDCDFEKTPEGYVLTATRESEE